MSNEREIAADKFALRAKMLDQLRALKSDDRVARSEKICARVFGSAHWRDAQSVLLFSPLRTEPQIATLETAAVVAGKSTFIIPQTLRGEAQPNLPFPPELILVPGLAFSHSGQRLGRGGGFYDRFLVGQGAKVFKLGVCFEFQLLESIPVEPHDAVMDVVITD